VEARTAIGGTSKSAVQQQCDEMKNWLIMSRYKGNASMEKKYKQ
jgi:hypothetical protein